MTKQTLLDLIADVEEADVRRALHDAATHLVARNMRLVAENARLRAESVTNDEVVQSNERLIAAMDAQQNEKIQRYSAEIVKLRADLAEVAQLLGNISINYPIAPHDKRNIDAFLNAYAKTL